MVLWPFPPGEIALIIRDLLSNRPDEFVLRLIQLQGETPATVGLALILLSPFVWGSRRTHAITTLGGAIFLILRIVLFLVRADWDNAFVFILLLGVPLSLPFWVAAGAKLVVMFDRFRFPEV